MPVIRRWAGSIQFVSDSVFLEENSCMLLLETVLMSMMKEPEKTKTMS